MRRISLFTFLAVLLFAAILPLQRRHTVGAVSEGERLSMYCKPAVVKIWAGPIGNFYYQPPNWTSGKTYQVSYRGWGSGFFINPDGYIATNAHVTQIYHDGDEKAKEILFQLFVQEVAADYKMDPRNLTRENIQFIAQHARLTDYFMVHHVIIPDGSAFPFEIKSYGAPVGQGENWKDVSLVKIEVKNAPTLVMGDSDKMNLQDHVTVIGYPGAANATQDRNTLSSKSSLESSITDGKISARKSTEGGAPVLQISAPTTHGNSGGPVLNDNMEVIGLLTFRGDVVNGQEVQGFNFVVASNTAKEFLAGAKNELGATDKAYREGLELYWTSQYKSAIGKFEEVKRLFPQHSEIDRLIQSSQQAVTDGKDRSGGLGGAGWLVIGVVALLFLIIAIIVIVVVVILLMRRKKSKPALPGAGPSARAVSAPPAAAAKPEPAKPAAAPFSPPPFSPPPPSPPPPPPPPAPRIVPQAPQGMPTDRTMDLSATIAIMPAVDTAPISYGKIKFVSGALTGQQFDVKPEGACIGRDASSSQIVIADPRISKRHLWIGVREGRVTIVDDGSRNGTFLNDPKSPRVTESNLSPGDTVILGESDVARFEYQS